MRTFAQKQNQPQQPFSSNLTRSNTTVLGSHRRTDLSLHLPRSTGNQARQRMLQPDTGEFQAGLAAAVSPRLGHHFSQIPIYPPAAGVVQMKLAISKPGDRYEQEADRLSEHVVRMSEPQRKRACPCSGGCQKYQTEQVRQEHKRLQTKCIGSSVSGETVLPPIVHQALRSPGQPLEPPVRTFMESRFGYDFSQVRVHTDARAVDSARALNALAYTAGKHVVFGAEQYAPDRAEGRRLLAHELTHVLQQRSPRNTFAGIVMRQPKKVATKFSDCTGTQSKQIESVVQDAKKALNKATAVLGSAYGKPSSLSAVNKQLLMDHFHTTSRDDLLKIFRKYFSIGLAFDAGLKFECETTCPKSAQGNVCGYAYNTMWFGGFGPIHICFDAAGCDFATTPRPNQVALTIHEAAHRHAGIDDKVYRWDTAKYNALSPKEAMDNADSYAWFAVLV